MMYIIRRAIHPIVLFLPKLRIKYKLVKENDYQVKADCPVIFACNHSNYNDVPIAFWSIGKHTYVLIGIQKLYMSDRLFFLLNGSIWVNRKDKAGRAKSKELIIQYLAGKKRSLLWFPEGTWNLSDNLLMLPMRWGIIESAMQTGAQIVPMAMDYERETKVCRVRFGTAYQIEKGADKAEEIRKLRDMMAELRWTFYVRQRVMKRTEMDVEKMREEIFQAVKEYPPLDWEYEKSVIFQQK